MEANYVATEGTHEEDVSLLQDQVRRLDDLIFRLNQDRAALLRRINNVQAKTKSLPPEILSTIFEFIRPPIDFDTHLNRSFTTQNRPLRRQPHRHEEDLHLDLGAVSYNWRQIVWSTPRLWTTISIGVYLESRIESCISLIDLYSQNARGLRLSVELDYRGQVETRDVPHIRMKVLSQIKSLEAVLFINNTSMIKKLILIQPPVEWLTVIDKNISQNNHSTISNSPLNQNTESLDTIIGPSFFRRVKLIQFSASPSSLSQSTITVLRLLRMPIDICMELLVRCPHVVQFESMEPTFPHNPGNAFSFPKPMILEHLEQLVWCCYHDWRFFGEIRHLRFTKLMTLVWSHDLTSGPSGIDPRYEFFSHLPPTLYSLTFNNLPVEFIPREPVIVNLLSYLPQLSELRFNECANDIILSAVNIIGRLFPVPTDGERESRNFRERNVLGNLRRLFVSSLPRGSFDPLMEMLEALHGSQPNRERFYLEISRGLSAFVSPPIERFRALVSAGFNVEITLDSFNLDLT